MWLTCGFVAVVCASNRLGRQAGAFLSGRSGPLLPSPSQRTGQLRQNGHCNRQPARWLRMNTSAFHRTSTLRRRLGSSAEQASPLLRPARRPHLLSPLPLLSYESRSPLAHLLCVRLIFRVHNETGCAVPAWSNATRPAATSAFLSKCNNGNRAEPFRAWLLLQNAFHIRKPFCDKMRVDLSKLITQKEAAEIRGCTPQAINQLVQRGSLKSVEVLGRRLVFRDEVEKFKPSKGGRPKSKTRSKKSN